MKCHVPGHRHILEKNEMDKVGTIIRLKSGKVNSFAKKH